MVLARRRDRTALCRHRRTIECPLADGLSVGFIRCNGGRMETIEWWARLDSDAKAWLIAHNGEAVSPEVRARLWRQAARSRRARGGSASQDRTASFSRMKPSIGSKPQRTTSPTESRAAEEGWHRTCRRCATPTGQCSECSGYLNPSTYLGADRHSVRHGFRGSLEVGREPFEVVLQRRDHRATNG